jgi:peptidoglycan/xylan/chitin deacetylase (PgdA/CDA1 family)
MAAAGLALGTWKTSGGHGGLAEHVTAGHTATTAALEPEGTSRVSPPAPLLPEVVFHGPRERPLVALTFDSNLTDSMIRELDMHRVASFANTGAVDELDRLRVPATLFLSGKWMERYPEITVRLAADPLFELASHSYAHLGFTPRCFHLGALSREQMAADVERSEEVLRRFTPRPTPFFRFPGGCYDAAALAAIRPTGVQAVQYDVASGDAFGRSASAIVGHTLSSVRNGSIVVMHITDGNTAPLTAKVLPTIVDGLRQRGFTLVRLSELLASGAGPQT